MRLAAGRTLDDCCLLWSELDVSEQLASVWMERKVEMGSTRASDTCMCELMSDQQIARTVLPVHTSDRSIDRSIRISHSP